MKKLIVAVDGISTINSSSIKINGGYERKIGFLRRV